MTSASTFPAADPVEFPAPWAALVLEVAALDDCFGVATAPPPRLKTSSIDTAGLCHKKNKSAHSAVTTAATAKRDNFIWDSLGYQERFRRQAELTRLRVVSNVLVPRSSRFKTLQNIKRQGSTVNE
jgi:hypothetical protein